VSAYIKECD